MNRYKLLTPGPLTTTDAVKKQMLEDRCTWDDEYKSITQQIRKELVRIAGTTEDKYTAVLMQGSGSFVVESVLTSVVADEDMLLIIANGAYGERMAQMAKIIGLQHEVYNVPYNEYPTLQHVEELLKDQNFTHIAIVHCETTTGILNPIAEIGNIAKKHNATFIVDAMSSFGGVEMNIEELQIDYLISSANKCIQGVPGFGFVIANKEKLLDTKGTARSVSLDLYDQWRVMDVDGKWRFTSPTHVVAAFAEALKELAEEGGVKARTARYAANNAYIRQRLAKVNMHAYIDEAKQSPIISTFLFPNAEFNFQDFYENMKKTGFVLYPGKLTDVDTFRIGNIGDVSIEDLSVLCDAIDQYMGVNV